MSAPGWLDELRAAQGLRTLLAQRGPQLAVVLLAALLAVQAGFLATQQNDGPPAPLPAHLPAGPRADAGRGPVQVGAIVNAHLFGVAEAPAASEAPRSAAPLVLAGVLAERDPRRGMAIIGPTAANSRLYAVGAAVAAGLTLNSVYPDRVLLDRGGTLESLMLPKQLGPPPSAPQAALPQSPGQRLAALVQNGDNGLLGGLVRAQAVFNGGKLGGYRIFPGGRTNVAAFTQLGLRAGDMITAVNGAPLDDPSHANEILQTLSSSSSASVTLQRNGQQQELTLNLETVANDAERAATEASFNRQRGGAFGGPLGAGRLPGLMPPPAPAAAPVPAPVPAVDDSVAAPVPAPAAAPPAAD